LSGHILAASESDTSPVGWGGNDPRPSTFYEKIPKNASYDPRTKKEHRLVKYPVNSKTGQERVDQGHMFDYLDDDFNKRMGI
jgi:hypothetical protein